MGGAKYALSLFARWGGAVTESAEVCLTNSLCRPRSLAAMLLVAFILGIAIGAWENFSFLFRPGPLFVPVILGLSLALSLVVTAAILPRWVAVRHGTVGASYLFWRRTIACSAVVRIRVVTEGRVDRFVFGPGKSHTLVVEYRSARGAPETTSFTVDSRISTALRTALADCEWVRED